MIRGVLYIYYTYRNGKLIWRNELAAVFAFSKKKLCNGEIFQIKDLDEFRYFWGSWVRIIGY